MTKLNLNERRHVSPDIWSALDSPGLGDLEELTLQERQLGSHYFQRLLDHPRIGEGLRVLDLTSNDLGPEQIRALASAPRLSGLRVLRLTHNRIGAQGLDCLAASTTLRGLTELEIREVGDTKERHYRMPPEAFERFARTFNLPALRTLDLSHNRVGLATVAALGANGGHAIEHLGLGANGLGRELVRVLCEAPWSYLRSLDICANEVGDDGAVALAEAPLLARLRKLDITGNPIGDDAMARLIAAVPLETELDVFHPADGPLGLVAFGWGREPKQYGPRALAALLRRKHDRGETFGGVLVQERASLEVLLESGLTSVVGSLTLSSVQITASDLERIAALSWPRLTFLCLSRCCAGKVFADALPALDKMPALRRLTLERDTFGPAGARALARSLILRQLERLSLDSTQLGDEGALAIMSSPNAAGLEKLSLNDNQLSEAGVLALAECPNLVTLRELWIGQNQVSEVQEYGDGGSAMVVPASYAVEVLRERTKATIRLR